MLELFSVGPWGPDFALRNSIEMVAGQPDLWVSPGVSVSATKASLSMIPR